MQTLWQRSGSRTCAAIAVLGLALSCPALAFDGLVVEVHDGDSITVLVDRQKVKVRLAGIDSPELSQPFGATSRRSLAELCDGRMAEVIDTGRKHRGRTIGKVRCAGKEADWHQVASGMAWVSPRYSKPTSPLFPLQEKSRSAGLGIWSEHHAIPPWEWRRSIR